LGYRKKLLMIEKGYLGVARLLYGVLLDNGWEDGVE
jgi:hypothetical protein